MKTNSEYLDKPGHCPNCDSNQVSGKSVEIENDMARQEVDCLECGAGWTDHYSLQEYTYTQLMTRIEPYSHDEIMAIIEPLKKENIWQSYARYPITDWRAEVANGDTHQGYWDYVYNCLSNEEFE